MTARRAGTAFPWLAIASHDAAPRIPSFSVTNLDGRASRGAAVRARSRDARTTAAPAPQGEPLPHKR